MNFRVVKVRTVVYYIVIYERTGIREKWGPSDQKQNFRVYNENPVKIHKPLEKSNNKVEYLQLVPYLYIHND